MQSLVCIELVLARRLADTTHRVPMSKSKQQHTMLLSVCVAAVVL